MVPEAIANFNIRPNKALAQLLQILPPKKIEETTFFT